MPKPQKLPTLSESIKAQQPPIRRLPAYYSKGSLYGKICDLLIAMTVKKEGIWALLACDNITQANYLTTLQSRLALDVSVSGLACIEIVIDMIELTMPGVVFTSEYRVIGAPDPQAYTLIANGGSVILTQAEMRLFSSELADTADNNAIKFDCSLRELHVLLTLSMGSLTAEDRNAIIHPRVFNHIIALIDRYMLKRARDNIQDILCTEYVNNTSIASSTTYTVIVIMHRLNRLYKPVLEYYGKYKYYLMLGTLLSAIYDQYQVVNAEFMIARFMEESHDAANYNIIMEHMISRQKKLNLI